MAILLGVIFVLFYYYVVEPGHAQLYEVQRHVVMLEKQIQQQKVKIKHLEELEAALKELEIELAMKLRRLPPRQEAIMLLKQVTDLGERLGLEIKTWKPKGQKKGKDALYMEMPVTVEVAGGYHTVAIFFDRIAKMPRIISVSGLKMGNAKYLEGRAIIKTTFMLTAYAALKQAAE